MANETPLQIELTLSNGVVTDAVIVKSSSAIFSGSEPTLRGSDPRGAAAFTGHMRGAGAANHGVACVSAVEDALGITIPDNARLLRNLMQAAQMVHEHVTHFYHRHTTDWVDIASALSANSSAASSLQKSISPWANNSPSYFAGVRKRLQNLVDSEQLHQFAAVAGGVSVESIAPNGSIGSTGYGDHPAYRLPPEGNLLAAAHILEAFDWQLDFNNFLATLGAWTPRSQACLVGGMATRLDKIHPDAVNPAKIAQLKDLVAQALTFITQVYLPDLLFLASCYPDWAITGRGVGNYLAYGSFPSDTSGNPAKLLLPRGIIYHGAIDTTPTPLDLAQLKEYVFSSFTAAETLPEDAGLMTPVDQVSWVQLPRYNDQAMEVGPLARLLVAYASRQTRLVELVDSALTHLQLNPASMSSTLGRMLARGIEAQLVTEQMTGWLDTLLANIYSNNLAVHNSARWNPACWPAEASGFGAIEAPLGALGHWIRIVNGKIASFQSVVPSAWNGSRRDASGGSGAIEAALIGLSIADPTRPLEVLRTIHTFEPLMACSVHITGNGSPHLFSVREAEGWFGLPAG